MILTILVIIGAVFLFNLLIGAVIGFDNGGFGAAIFVTLMLVVFVGLGFLVFHYIPSDQERLGY